MTARAVSSGTGNEALAARFNVSVSRSEIIRRGLTRRCPNCGHSPIFTGLRLLPSCPVCYMALQRGSGWWLGPLVINYGIVVFVLVLPLLGLGLFEVIPLSWAIRLSMAAGLLVPFALYRFSWGLWLMTYYLVLPHELPGNNTDFDPVDNL